MCPSNHFRNSLCARHFQLLLWPCCSLQCFLFQTHKYITFLILVSYYLPCNQSAQSCNRNSYYQLWPTEKSYSHQWIPYWFSKFSVLWVLLWRIAGFFFFPYTYIISPLECHFCEPFDPSAMNILQLLIHLVWLFIFLSFQEHVNTLSHGFFEIIHHCHTDKFSIINFMFQSCRSTNLNALRI